MWTLQELGGLSLTAVPPNANAAELREADSARPSSTDGRLALLSLPPNLCGPSDRDACHVPEGGRVAADLSWSAVRA